MIAFLVYINHFYGENVETNKEVVAPLDVTYTDDASQKETSTQKTSISTKSNINRFAFVGDIILSDRIIGSYNKGGVDGILDKNYKKIFDECEVVAGNLECTITNREDAIPDKQFHFKVPASYSNCFKELGFTLLSLANNHILDYGQEGLMDTIKELDKLDIGRVGAGRDITEASAPKILEIGGRTYAIFSTSLVFPNSKWKAKNDNIGINTGHDIDRICRNINGYKGLVDKIFVIIHWGKELEESSNDYQRKIAYYLVNAGADMIIGSHSHTIQEIEYYKNVPIIYSLGNFIYGRTLRDTMVIEAEVDYSKDVKGSIKLRAIPGVANYLKTHRSGKPEDIKEKLNALDMKSDSITIDEKGYIKEVQVATLSDIVTTDQETPKVHLSDITNATISEVY